MPLPAKRPLRVIGTRTESGLTLIEVLVSLSLTAVLLGVISQFLYTGIHLKNKSERAYERQHLMKAIYQTVSNDISPLATGPYLPENALKGDQYELSFWRESNAGLHNIKYRYDPQTKKVYKAAGFWGSKPEETVIFDDISDWKFSYYDPKTKWHLSEWDLKLKEEIPSLIGISIKTKTADLGTIFIPVKVWHSEDKSN